jgi:hypothetical protein
MRLLVRVIALAASAIAFFSQVAKAETIVIESHVGGRANGTAEILAPLYEELERREVRHDYPKVGQRFEAQSSAPSQVGAGLAADFPEAVERAYRLWIAGKFHEAIAAMKPLVDEAHRNPASVANNPKVGAAVFKSLVTLALCHHRLGDKAASWEAMAELLRSFDLDFPKGQYGAEAYEIFARVKGRGQGRRFGKPRRPFCRREGSPLPQRAISQARRGDSLGADPRPLSRLCSAGQGAGAPAHRGGEGRLENPALAGSRLRADDRDLSGVDRLLVPRSERT